MKLKVAIAIIAVVLIIILLLLLLNRKTYNITFDSNGGSLVETVSVKKNDTIPEPEDPTKENYVFAGWYYNDELYDFNTPVTSNMELEARWAEAGKASGIKLEQTKLNLNLGDTTQLVATVESEDAKNQDLIWESSNPDVVSVDSKGNIKALKAGSAVITVTTKDGEYKAKAEVWVKENEETEESDTVVTGVSLNKTTLTLTEGGSSKLTATVNPSNAANKNVTWKSSNPSIVSVDSNGNIKALKAGSATITVTTEDGSYTATAKITVKEKANEDNPTVNTTVNVTGVSLNKTTLTLTEGGSSKLTATVNPSNATNKNVTWVSSNSNVASVDSNGNVKALKAGTATITATTKDGNYKATCQVTVNEKPASYSVIFTPIVQEGTNAVVQYSVAVTKNNSSFTGYKFINYNGTVVKKTLSSATYNKGITSATIRLSDGTDVTATVIYK